MAVGNAYVERSTGDTNCDINRHLIIRKSSQHSEIIVDKEGVSLLNGNVTTNETETHCLKFDGATNHKCSKEKLMKENEKISGKSSFNDITNKEKESHDQNVSSDEDSTLSSCSSSDDDGQEASDKQNIYEELLKRLKANEEKKNINKNKSSSENSSSTFQKSHKTNISPKKYSSNSTINEDNFEKRNGDIENLNVGVDFFLPSSVTEKFQEMFYEDSGEEEQNNANKDKGMRVTFDDLIIGRPNKNSFVGETLLENTSSQNRSLIDETKEKVSHRRQKAKVKETFYDASSVHTKSENTKQPVCNSAVMDLKLHSPEMTLYRKLSGLPLKHEIKKNGGRKDIKSKKTTVANSRQKPKNIIIDPKLKILPDKKNIVAFDNSKKSKTEARAPRTISNTEKDCGKDAMIKNENRLKNNFVTASKNLQNKSGIEIIASNAQPKKVEEVKLINDVNVKRGNFDEIYNIKEEVEHDNIVNSDSKNRVLNKNHVNNVDGQTNLKKKSDSKNTISNKNYLNKEDDQSILKRKLNSDSKTTMSKKNPVLITDDKGIAKEKLSQPAKNAIINGKKPTTTKTEYLRKNTMRTLTENKELSSKHNSINSEIAPVNMELKTNKEQVRPSTFAHLVQPKKEPVKQKVLSARKEERFDVRNLHSLDKSSKTKEPSESLKGRQHLTKETIHSQSINEMKTHTVSFPFILGQSTSKTYNVRAAIQQTMSMIMRSPAETLRRSSFSDMLNVSSKASTLKTSVSDNTRRKVCPACVVRVDEEDCEPDENPLDPWDTEYHSKRFVRCTCMPRNTVNFKTVMNQLLQETSSSYILPTESCQDTEVENGEDNRVNKSLFRKNNNIYKLSQLLHTLLKIRDLLVT
ncbi:myb-like protein F isoform X2 [Halyomorpha halys]|nr:protein PFC0760c-like isoform X2 [Halyomorpha halys]